MRTKKTLDKTLRASYNRNVEDMFTRISIYSVLIILLALIVINNAYAVGLEVGAFGGVAVPTGGMRTEGGFELRSSPEISVIALLGINKYSGLEIRGGYNFNHPPRTKEYDWAEYTRVMPVNVGGYLKTTIGNIGFSLSGGLGYYFLQTKLVGTIDATGVCDTGFGNRAYPARVNMYAPGVYSGISVSYLFRKFALVFTPRFNYVFNNGTYDGKEIRGAGIERTIPINKNWNDSYLEFLLGVTYDFF
jgi:hypothetical protein